MRTRERGPPSALAEIGPSGVRALPLAAGTNEGGHYFAYIFPLLLLLLVTAVIQNHRRGCRIVSNFSSIEAIMYFIQ